MQNLREKFVYYLADTGLAAPTVAAYTSAVSSLLKTGFDPRTRETAQVMSPSAYAACGKFAAFLRYVGMEHIDMQDLVLAWSGGRRAGPATNPSRDAFRAYLDQRGLSAVSVVSYLYWADRIAKDAATGRDPKDVIRGYGTGSALAQSAWKHYQTFLNPPPPKPDFSALLDVLPELARSGWLEPLAAGATWQDIVTVHGLPGLRAKGTTYCLTSTEPLRRLRAWGCPDDAGCLILPARPRSWSVPALADLREAVKQARATTGQPPEHRSSTLPAFPSPPPTLGDGQGSQTPGRGRSEEISIDLTGWAAEVTTALDDLSNPR